MKNIDFGYRVAPTDIHLVGNNLIGVEVGVDVGAHAEALLTFCRIEKLSLVDIWDNPQQYGYCLGRLETKFKRGSFEMIPTTSIKARELFENNSLDFIYFDHLHDYDSVKNDLNFWLIKLKRKAIIGYRHYMKYPGLTKAIDDFLKMTNFKFIVDNEEIIIFNNISKDE